MVKNFRDLSLIKTKHGNQLEKGKIFRSGELSALSDKEVAKFKKLNIKLIIDLRSTIEVMFKEDRKIDGVEHLHFPIVDFKDDDMPKNNEEFLTGNKRFSVKNMYDIFLRNQDCKDQFKKLLNIVRNYDYSKGSILFHCTSGKDRTGLLAAFYLKELGYSKEEILKDYAYSNRAYFFKARTSFVNVLLKTKSLKKAKGAYSFYFMKKKNILPIFEDDYVL